ncbi:hypothetical protein MJH12_17940, partial [bacterium]|nr:hypothetical protein [bacterium]
QCETSNTRGTCVSENYWQGSYISIYDSLTKTIVTSASIQYIEASPYEALDYIAPVIRFDQSKEMALSWE